MLHSHHRNERDADRAERGETKDKTMQHETSIAHAQNLKSGLKVSWVRSNGNGDNAFDVVAYTDGSRWVFDNGSAERVTLLGEVSDGITKAEVLESSTGAIIALYSSDVEAFADREQWIESLAESDKAAATALLA